MYHIGWDRSRALGNSFESILRWEIQVFREVWKEIWKFQKNRLPGSSRRSDRNGSRSDFESSSNHPESAGPSKRPGGLTFIHPRSDRQGHSSSVFLLWATFSLLSSSITYPFVGSLPKPTSSLILSLSHLPSTSSGDLPHWCVPGLTEGIPGLTATCSAMSSRYSSVSHTFFTMVFITIYL